MARYTNPGWANGGPPAINQQNMNDMSNTLQKLDSYSDIVAEDYSATKAYALGEYCKSGGNLYMRIGSGGVAGIAVGNTAVWQVVSVGERLKSIGDIADEAAADTAAMKSALNAIGLDIENGIFVIAPVTA